MFLKTIFSCFRTMKKLSQARKYFKKSHCHCSVQKKDTFYCPICNIWSNPFFLLLLLLFFYSLLLPYMDKYLIRKLESMDLWKKRERNFISNLLSGRRSPSKERKSSPTWPTFYGYLSISRWHAMPLHSKNSPSCCNLLYAWETKISPFFWIIIFSFKLFSLIKLVFFKWIENFD